MVHGAEFSVCLCFRSPSFMAPHRDERGCVELHYFSHTLYLLESKISVRLTCASLFPLKLFR